MKISDVKIDYVDGKMLAQVVVHGSKKTAVYAFYLYRGRDRVDVSWYSELNNVSFLVAKVGVYRVVGFVKDEDKVIWMSSPEFFFTGNMLFEKKETDLESLVDFEIISSGWYSVKGEGSEGFDVILNGFGGSSDESHFLVVFNGAVKRGKGIYPPFFSGVNLASETSLPVVSIADPTLGMDDNITLGWYGGNNNINSLQSLIVCLIDGLARKLNSMPILVGGSGGGFASLATLSKLTSGKAVVWNPQTDIKKYYKPTYDTYKSVAFFGQENNIKEKVFVNELMADDGEKTVIYLQNKNDSFHIESHARPFFKKSLINPDLFGFQRDSTFVYIMGDWRGGGHVSPPAMALISIVNILNNNLSLDEVSEIFHNNLE